MNYVMSHFARMLNVQNQVTYIQSHIPCVLNIIMVLILINEILLINVFFKTLKCDLFSCVCNCNCKYLNRENLFSENTALQ